mmetsp:Transcript_27954/g.31684  ORF Transcript_27954/g.31684 Transcript_27954/m.31684 type:complete len:543 (-) Transcript_27954:73-1701(-)
MKLLSLNKSFPSSSSSFLSSLRLLTTTRATCTVAATGFTSSSLSSCATAAGRPCTTSNYVLAVVDLQQHLRHQHQYHSSTGNSTIFTTSSLSTPDNRTMMSSRSRSSNTNNKKKVFQAWRVEEQDDGSFVGSEQTLSLSLPKEHNKNMVLIKVTHSSLNYKDALSSSGTKGGVTRNFPHTPGIDAAGYIVNTNKKKNDDDDDDDNVYDDRKGRSPSTSVLVTGYDLGMNTDGGYGEYIYVPKEWIISPNPFLIASSSGIATTTTVNTDIDIDTDTDAANRVAMIYGTAGLTAALSVDKLLTVGNATPSDGKILVTGASGSVGSVAIELLSKLGFDVVAITDTTTGNTKQKIDQLLRLGAKEVLGRDALEEKKKPLLKPQYAHGLDTVGGSPLVELLKQIQYGGSVTCCGNVAGMELLSLTVLPFILRGIQLIGVDSVQIPLEEKRQIWNKLATIWKCSTLESESDDDSYVTYIGRNELDCYLQSMLPKSNDNNGNSSASSSLFSFIGPGKIVLDHSLTTTTTNHESNRIGSTNSNTNTNSRL